MRSGSEEGGGAGERSPVADTRSWRATPRGFRRLMALIAALGVVSFAAVLAAFGPDPWPLLPWLGLTAVGALLTCFPYRVDHGTHSYLLDFDELLLVIAMLYLAPAAIVAMMIVGYLVGATLSARPSDRIVFNTGTRATAAAAALAVAYFMPLPTDELAAYVVSALTAAAIYSVICQALVSQALALWSSTRFMLELRQALAGENLRYWPMAVIYGLLVALASLELPFVLLLASVPVILLIGASRLTQRRRDEYRRMTGLYQAAQEMHEARSAEDLMHIVRQVVRRTLGERDAMVRAAPPTGDELGAWLPSRSAWIVVPGRATGETRVQDDAFLQALASLVDTGIERATLVGELERQSLRDPLTNAFNRRYFHQALSSALERDDASGCLALLDIDHFKEINDDFGHEVGDNALKELVAAVAETFREGDTLCRIGGDEFALILPGLAPERAVRRLEALRERLAAIAPGQTPGGPLGFQLSMGIAAYPEHGRDPAALLRAADQALYGAKRAGRDRVVVTGEPDGRRLDERP